MASHSFNDLRQHVGHDIVCVAYGDPWPVNVALECTTCGEVLLDFDKPDELVNLFNPDDI